MKHILVTGGAGYIGSHVVVELIDAGFEPVIVDNFSTSDETAIKNLEKLTDRKITFYRADYQNAVKLNEIIDKERVDGVIHIAGYKAVGESVADPLKYYENNVSGFVTLLEALLAKNIYNFVFSSSAALYGTPDDPKGLVTEESRYKPESPYGWSKMMDEVILRDTCTANPELKGIALRYFNVVGSHESIIIGDSPKGKPQNLLPIIVKALSEHKEITVYGTDYPTPDGSCLRDYIHVVDLAKAHVAALQKMIQTKSGSYEVYNISTGIPTSVIEMIATFERVNKIKVPHILGPRRPGDPPVYYASPDKANHELHWHAEHTIDEAVRSAWNWQQITNK
jgi:UDP-glucose 4-epimerase